MASETSVQRAGGISLRQLRLFEAIGDVKSVRKASEECGLSQPAVTQALAKLEEQVGAALVDRSAYGSYLNAAGTIFHARVKRFFDQTSDAVIASGGAATAVSARSIVNRLTRSQLRMLIVTIERGSFESAAEALHISAASLQRSARDLESNLGAPLFYRTALGMLVSPLGIRFGRQMKLALQEVEWGVEEVDAVRGGSSRPIVIGAMPFGGSVLLAAALDDFLKAHPGADIRILSDSAAVVSKSLRIGDVDLVIGLLPEMDTEELVSEALAETPLFGRRPAGASAHAQPKRRYRGSRRLRLGDRPGGIEPTAVFRADVRWAAATTGGHRDVLGTCHPTVARTERPRDADDDVRIAVRRWASAGTGGRTARPGSVDRGHDSRQLAPYPPARELS